MVKAIGMMPLWQIVTPAATAKVNLWWSLPREEPPRRLLVLAVETGGFDSSCRNQQRRILIGFPQRFASWRFTCLGKPQMLWIWDTRSKRCCKTSTLGPVPPTTSRLLVSPSWLSSSTGKRAESHAGSGSGVCQSPEEMGAVAQKVRG